LSILGIVPARGGSKGVPRKNIKLLGGIPLLGWTIRVALQSTKIDRLILTTEDPEIAEIGLDFGIDVPFIRPFELAADDTHTPDILTHALDELEVIEGIRYENVVLLQPTVPFRKVEHIDRAIEKFRSSSFESLMTIQRQDYPPWWMFKLSDNGLKLAFDYKEKLNVFNLERQQFPAVYKPNGSVYITASDSLKKNGQLVNPNSCDYLLVEDEYQINIDTHLDFSIAETLLSELRIQ
jgi:CMP-N,N'-diacetyllegionaminic acid synthase